MQGVFTPSFLEAKMTTKKYTITLTEKELLLLGELVVDSEIFQRDETLTEQGMNDDGVKTIKSLSKKLGLNLEQFI